MIYLNSDKGDSFQIHHVFEPTLYKYVKIIWLDFDKGEIAIMYDDNVDVEKLLSEENIAVDVYENDDLVKAINLKVKLKKRHTHTIEYTINSVKCHYFNN